MTSSHRPAFTRVLCPTDFSEFSPAALTYAAALAAPPTLVGAGRGV